MTVNKMTQKTIQLDPDYSVGYDTRSEPDIFDFLRCALCNVDIPPTKTENGHYRCPSCNASYRITGDLEFIERV